MIAFKFSQPLLAIDSTRFRVLAEPATTRLTLHVSLVKDVRFFSDLAMGIWSTQDVETHWNATFNWRSIFAFRSQAETLAIHDEDGLQALLQVDQTTKLPCAPFDEGPMLYVSFLEVAPWNRVNRSSRRYRGIGALLIMIAADRSRQIGAGGRLGLHTMEDAGPFYRSLGFSSRDCPNEYNELFMELSIQAAARLLQSAASSS